MRLMESIREQLKSNAVALISLTIALIALGHDTWRSEVSEENRNIRIASFEVLKNLGELQVVVNASHFSDSKMNINPMNGWGYIALIGDLSQLIPEPVPEKAQQLVKTWGSQWSNIHSDETAADAITEKIDDSRLSVLEVLRSLH